MAILHFTRPRFILHGINMENIPWKSFHGISTENFFHGNFTCRTRGQKHIKTPWRPIVFQGNSMKYKTGTSLKCSIELSLVILTKQTNRQTLVKTVPPPKIAAVIIYSTLFAVDQYSSKKIHEKERETEKITKKKQNK